MKDSKIYDDFGVCNCCFEPAPLCECFVEKITLEQENELIKDELGVDFNPYD